MNYVYKFGCLTVFLCVCAPANIIETDISSKYLLSLGSNLAHVRVYNSIRTLDLRLT